MKNNAIKIVSLAFISFSLCAGPVTYEFSGGRFGDNLLAYLHGKWISFKYGTPLIYKPFKYSEHLRLHVNESQIMPKNLAKRTLSKENMKVDPNENCLLVVPWFSEISFERAKSWNKKWIYFEIDWENKKFYDEIVELIQPINARLAEFELPNNYITVALHVRKGEGFDGPLLSEAAVKKEKGGYADWNAPLKFPPDYFYIDQLKTVSEYFGHAKIYAYIFTDAKNPSLIAQRFKAALADYPNIEFDYRKLTNNTHDTNVLEDFFALLKFDCLIRPQSSFSIAAAKLTNYKLEIYPTEHHWDGIKSVIDKVEVKTERVFH